MYLVYVLYAVFSHVSSEEFDKEFNDDPKVENLKPALQQYRIIYRFLMIWEKERDKERFEKLCRLADYLFVAEYEDNNVIIAHTTVTLYCFN